MKIKGISEEELALLSPEERAAIEEEDTDAADLKAIADGKGPGDEDDDGDAAKAAAKEAAEAAAVAAKAEADAKLARAAELKKMNTEQRAAAEAEDAAAAEAAAAEATAASDAEALAKAAAEKKAAGEPSADDDDDVPARRLPRYAVKPVEKYEEQLAAIGKESTDAMVTFKAGDLEIAELLTKQAELEARKADLREAKIRADMGTEFNESTANAEWLNSVQDFMGEVKDAEGIDYTKPFLNAAFDTAIKTLAADKANAARSERWFLREAHKAVKAEIGIVAKPLTDAEKAEAAKAAAAKAKLAGRKPLTAAIKDVGGLPSAGDDDATGADPEFAAIDRLEGQEFEDALAKMPKAKQDKFLRRQTG